MKLKLLAFYNETISNFFTHSNRYFYVQILGPITKPKWLFAGLFSIAWNGKVNHTYYIQLLYTGYIERGLFVELKIYFRLLYVSHYNAEKE